MLNVVTNASGIGAPDHEGELNYISKYLIQYVPMKKGPKTSKHATGARVLISDEYTKRIFEQEEKKEKEARKAE